ncbi:MAG: hypothetical protein ACI9DM_002190 [Cyclobacteriaceae bacterium]|jgi:hypothetical protein
MAGLGSSQGNKFKFLSLRFIKEDQRNYFCVMAKKDDTWVPTEKHTFIEGKLVDIEVKEEKTKKGEEYKKIVMSFDLGESLPIHKVDTGFSMLSRSLINTLASCDEQIKNGQELNISVYVNKNGYGAMCVREPGSTGSDGMYGWKYTMDQLPKPVPHMISGKKVHDYGELDAMIEKIIDQKIRAHCPGIPERDVAPEAPSSSNDLPEEKPAVRKHDSTPQKANTGMDLPDPGDMPPDDLPF